MFCCLERCNNLVSGAQTPHAGENMRADIVMLVFRRRVILPPHSSLKARRALFAFYRLHPPLTRRLCKAFLPNSGQDACPGPPFAQQRSAGCRGVERQLRGPAHGLACGRSPLGNRRSSKLIAVVRKGGQGKRPGPNLAETPCRASLSGEDAGGRMQRERVALSENCEEVE